VAAGSFCWATLAAVGLSALLEDDAGKVDGHLVHLLANLLKK
jgi:hypothetical protein